MMLAQRTTVVNLKVMESAKAGRDLAGQLPEEAGACSEQLQPSCRDRELAGELLEREGLQLG